MVSPDIWARISSMRKREDAARKTARTCGECGREMNVGRAPETVYLVRDDNRKLTPWCEDCALKWWDFQMRWSLRYGYRYRHGHTIRDKCNGECENCGTPLVYWLSLREARMRKGRPRCSERCGGPTLSARPKAKRPRKVYASLCEVCGKVFRPSRSDAKHCSGGCRQKAYRQRQKA